MTWRPYRDERSIVTNTTGTCSFHDPVHSLAHRTECAEDGLFRPLGEVEIALRQVRRDFGEGRGQDGLRSVFAERRQLLRPRRKSIARSKTMTGVEQWR